MSSEIVVVGLSHRTAPIALREKLSVPALEVPSALDAVMAPGVFSESLLVSTCNRVELYAVSNDPEACVRAARGYLEGRADPDEASEHLYVRSGAEAIRHVFRVAASLDSMVVGEPQILGQLKEAYDLAAAHGALGSLLSRCFHRAFAVAKRVRTETGIAAGMVSVSSIGCELARKIFGDLRGRRALLLGAGEMGEAAARALASDGAHLVVINRSPEKAKAVAAAFEGEAREFEHMASELVAADVVISSTSAQRFVLTEELMKGVVKARRRRPLFLIDIAVPRDVDPRVGRLDSVFLYDVDDLQQVAEQNLKERRKEAAAAEALVLAELDEFERWRRSLVLTPTIVGLRERVQGILQAEIDRTAQKLPALAADRKALDRMCQAMTNKILHAPIQRLKESADGPEAAALITAARTLFDLDEELKRAPAQTRAVPELAPAPGGRKPE